jgi:hypothetical protein
MTAYQVGQIFGAFIGALVLVSIAYYLIKRRRVPFRSVLSHKGVIVASLMGAVISLTAQGFPSAPNDSGRALSDDEMVSFYAGCVEPSKARLSEAAAKQHCACIITEIQNTYTQNEFRESSAEANRTGVVSSKMIAIVRKCEVAPP